MITLAFFLFVNFSPIYPTGRYITTTINNIGPTLTISDNDQVSSALLKSSQRSKSPMAANPNLIPAHTYYTRSKSVYD